MDFKKNASILILLLLVSLVIGLVSFSSLKSSETAKQRPEPSAENTPVRKEIPRQFGLPLDSFNVHTKNVQRNEFLAGILQEYEISPSDIAVLSERSREVYDVRKIAAGRPYTVFCPKDNPSKAAYFVYQASPVNYVIYDLRDSMRVYTGKHPVTTRVKALSGVINSSLYLALEKQGAEPSLAMELAKVYASTVDFFAIRKGDWFKIQYEQRYVKGEPVGEGQILSAVFSHRGKEFQAYYFQADSTKSGEYYDENGKAMRRAFLKAPLEFFRISSRYSRRRLHPVQKVWKAHLGTDYAAPHGTPILATGSGTVIESGYTGGNGNYVKIRHDNVYTTQYLHMSRRAVRRGQHVTQGQVIGYVGSTGLATGPHVCYRFWKHGRQVDHLREKFPEAKTIAEDQRLAFEQVMQARQEILAGIEVVDPAAFSLAFNFPERPETVTVDNDPVYGKVFQKLWEWASLKKFENKAGTHRATNELL